MRDVGRNPSAKRFCSAPSPMIFWSAWSGATSTARSAFEPADAFQVLQRLLEGILVLREVEAGEVVHWLLEEARSGDGPDAYIMGEVLAERLVVVIPVLRYVDQDVVRPLRNVMCYPRRVQPLHEEVPLHGVPLLEVPVVIVAEEQPGH